MTLGRGQARVKRRRQADSEGLPGGFRRVALGVTPQSSHRYGLAPFGHPARHVVDSLSLVRPVELAVTRLEVQCPRRGSVLWSATRRPLRSTESGRAHSPASSLLRSAPTPVRRSRRTSLPSLGDTTFASCLLPASRRRAVGRGVGIPVPEPDLSVETDGSLRFPSHPRVPAPCSWTPVGPNTPGHCGVSTRPPLVSTTEAPAMNISGLDSTALGLAVYASQ
jgi:hypothetical protein